MPDIISDGMTRISWVASISNAGAPTVAELNAGVALESLITADGLDTPTTSDRVDNSSLASTQNTELIGRRTDQPTLTFKQQGKTAAPWTTFAGKPSGYLVRRTGVAASTAWTASQKVTVMPVQAGYRNELAAAKNEVEKFSVDFAVTGEVRDDATVA